MLLGLAVTAVAEESKPIKVGVCIYQFNDNFMTLYRTELEKYLKETYNADVTVVDGKNDQTEQTNQINSFIAEGVDVLIVNLVQSTSAATVIDLVEAAGIPTVFINREPSEEDMEKWMGKIAYVGADARQSGTFQGEIVAATENKGDFNGNGTVDYVMIMGDPENVDAPYRTEYSIKALNDAGITTNKLFEQRGDFVPQRPGAGRGRREKALVPVVGGIVAGDEIPHIHHFFPDPRLEFRHVRIPSFHRDGLVGQSLSAGPGPAGALPAS